MAGSAGEQVAELTVARRIARAAELLRMYDWVDAGLWAGYGFGSPSAWLAAATGEPFGACKRALFLGGRLRDMPVVREAFCDGSMSEAALGLLADAWSEGRAEVFERDEVMLVDWVVRLPFSDARTVIGTWVAHADPDGAGGGDGDRYERRRLHVSSMLDGMHVVDGVLDADGAARLNQAIALLSGPAELETRTAAQRRADALVSMADFVLTYHEVPAGVKRRRRSVVATIDYRWLRDNAGCGHLGNQELSAEVIRRMACDAGIHRLVTAGRSAVLEYGRQTRTISDGLFEALAARDGGCRWPGCEIGPGFCDAHHAVHWADWGETEIDNLALLCWHHHHSLHDQHWSLEPCGAGDFTLISPAGTRHDAGPSRLSLTRL